MSESYNQPNVQGPYPEHHPQQAQAGQNPMPGYAYPQGGYYNPALAEGQKLSQNSLILGIISLIAGVAGFSTLFTGLAGLVLGPLAFSKAAKAKKLGYPSTAGQLMGSIGLALSIVSILFWIGVVLCVLLLAYASSTSNN